MSADQTEREALAWGDRDLTGKWKRAATAARAAEHHFPADCLSEAVGVYEALCDQINSRPTPRTVTTVEDIPRDGNVLDGNGNLCAIVRDGYYVAGLAGMRALSKMPLPATVLAPAIDPDDEALVASMAQAACEFHNPGDSWDDFTGDFQDWCRDMIRAALKVARP